MSDLRAPLHEAAAAQARAADPARSVWVTANAGSGKTRVLIDRVARLLWGGTKPARILCLTYTRTAAAEMQERLFRRLGDWAMMEDDALSAALAGLGIDAAAAGADGLARARRLFAEALDTPGGLRIQTIHAFCDGLLRRFPLEAGVPPGFSVLDDRAAARIAAETRDRHARDAETGADGSFDALADLLSEDGLDRMAAAILRNRARFPRNLGADMLRARLGARLPPRSPADRAADIRAAFDPATLSAIAAALVAGAGKTDAKAAAALRRFLDGSPPEAALADLFAAFFTQEGTPRSKRGFPAKDALRARPALAEEMDRLGALAATLRAEDRAEDAALRTAALHRFARAALDLYADGKAASGTLDFDDLVTRAQTLLTRSDMAAWALWKLDGGIDHILVDEAQDTAPAQWDVIGALAAEFLAGSGARELSRTLFVVGDLKQSIYSFQGADPSGFLLRRDGFARRLSALGRPFEEGTLRHSFRSAPAILDAVDATFRDSAAEGLAPPGEPIRHAAVQAAKPGRVELWPFLPAPEKAPAPEWDAPFDAPAPGDPRVALARILAAEIAGWLAAGRMVEGRDEPLRPMRPGDILVLVQRRNILARRLLAELKALGVPVAGEDRLLLTGELAVKDILATLAFVATPADDLALAAALRSPLFGVSEETLFALAHGRPGLLWQALRSAGPPEAVAILTDLRDAADYLRPFELVDRLLTRHRGRERLVARLGPECEDAVDELLAQALAFEQGEVPSLPGFLAWIAADDASVKRDSASGGDVLRVMTVHGAKGLEAPVVILPDTAPPRGNQKDPILPDGDLAFWRPAKADRPALLDAAAEAEAARDAEERRRLLYVAMTRAASLLVVAGAGRRDPEKDSESWYALVEAGLARAGAREEPAPEGLAGPRRVLETGWEERTGPPAARLAAPAATLPPWALAPPPPAAPAPRPLAPSGLGGAHAIPGEAGDEESFALDRGTFLHALLERLAPLPEAARPEAAAAAAAARPDGPALAAEALAALALPGMADFLGPDSLAEVPFAADLPGLGRIEGRIDRLAVAGDRVRALDYKSNRTLPRGVAEVPEAFLRQMGATQAALERIFPGRIVSVALLWTAGPRLMPLPRDHLLAALGRVAPST